METIKFIEGVHREEDRCRSTTSKGPCAHLSVKGTERCPHHGANKIIEKHRRLSLGNYNLTKHKNKIKEMSQMDTLNSLNEEVSMMRLVLEQLWNSCEDEHGMIFNGSAIMEIADKIRKCVESCHKLEMQNNELVPKEKFKEFMRTISGIIDSHVEDKAIKASISIAIGDWIENLGD